MILPRSVRQLHIEDQAKAAYGIYAHRTNATAAFERLSDEEQSAWREIVQYFEQDPECDRCGEVLFCLDCDAKAIEEDRRMQELIRSPQAAESTKAASS